MSVAPAPPISLRSAAAPLPVYVPVRLPRWAVPALVAASPLLIVAMGPLFWQADPLAQNLIGRLAGMTPQHPLGTDELGRDMLARILRGGQLSLGVSAAVTAVTAVIGVALGSIAAQRCGGLLDALLMRLIDILLAFPFLLVALAVAGLAGGGVGGIFIALVLFGWVTHALVSRAETVRVSSGLFVEAARACGATPLRVYTRHVLPNALPPLIVISVVRFSQTLLAIAGLSFLGVGVQPPTPEWGALLSEGMPFVERAPLLLLVPGVAVTLSCLVLTLGSEALRRALKPPVVC